MMLELVLVLVLVLVLMLVLAVKFLVLPLCQFHCPRCHKPWSPLPLTN